MSDFVGMMAFGKTQSLSDAECMELWRLTSRDTVPHSIEFLHEMVALVKLRRPSAPMPAPHTHTQWTEQREARPHG